MIFFINGPQPDGEKRGFYVDTRPVIIHPRLAPERRVIAVSDIHGNLPFFRALLDKIALTPAIDVDKVLREIKDRYAGEQVNDIDGVKIDFAENWVHLRKSNTEPIIRIYTEARSMAEADALAQRFIGELGEICNL